MEGEPLGPREEVASDKDAATDVTIITPRPAVVIDAIEFDATEETVQLSDLLARWKYVEKGGSAEKEGARGLDVPVEKSVKFTNLVLFSILLFRSCLGTLWSWFRT